MGTPVPISATTTTTSSTSAMKTAAVLVALSCLAALVVAEPRFRALQKEEPRLGCSINEILKCEKEIEQAVKDCSHISDVDSIMTCVNDILATKGCQKCICDVIPFLCP